MQDIPATQPLGDSGAALGDGTFVCLVSSLVAARSPGLAFAAAACRRSAAAGVAGGAQWWVAAHSAGEEELEALLEMRLRGAPQAQIAVAAAQQ